MSWVTAVEEGRSVQPGKYHEDGANQRDFRLAVGVIPRVGTQKLAERTQPVTGMDAVGVGSGHVSVRCLSAPQVDTRRQRAVCVSRGSAEAEAGMSSRDLLIAAEGAVERGQMGDRGESPQL